MEEDLLFLHVQVKILELFEYLAAFRVLPFGMPRIGAGVEKDGDFSQAVQRVFHIVEFEACPGQYQPVVHFGCGLDPNAFFVLVVDQEPLQAVQFVHVAENFQARIPADSWLVVSLGVAKLPVQFFVDVMDQLVGGNAGCMEGNGLDIFFAHNLLAQVQGEFFHGRICIGSQRSKGKNLFGINLSGFRESVSKNPHICYICNS